ncbi:MAG: MBL fold metallo-hydrolase [Arcobacter sp.]|nr:MAG: MBL fold metallo-hydrolase [Arcobacter sp.]
MIRKIILGLIISSLTLFGFEYKLEPKKVSDNVWCFFGKLEKVTKENGGYMSNSCYVKTKNSYVVIDSGPTYNFAKEAYKVMSKIKKLPVKAVINTHDHDDHWLGNSFYKETFDAQLIGVELQDKNYKAGDKTRMFHLLSEDAIKGTKIVKLDKHIKKLTTLQFGGEKFILVPIGTKAHTAEDIFIFMPKRKILFSGDLVMNGRITSNRDGSVIGSLKALEMINSYKWEILIPGHGFDISKTATDEFVQYFTLLKKRVLKAVEEDVGASEVNNFVHLNEFKDKALFEELNKSNIFDAYRELEFYEEE